MKCPQCDMKMDKEIVGGKKGNTAKFSCPNEDCKCMFFLKDGLVEKDTPKK